MKMPNANYETNEVTIVTCHACRYSISYDTSCLTSSHVTLSQLRSGYASGLSEGRTVTGRAKYELQRITAEVDFLSAALDKLLQAQQAFRTVVIQQSSLVAPVRRLPVELLELVFSNCLQMNVISNHLAEPCSLPTLTLSHVIHHWRSIIWHMPSMWSNIALAIGSRRSHQYPDGLQRLALLRMYLARSSSLPLAVRISPSPTSSTYASSLVLNSDLALLEGLADQSARWRTLTIEVSIIENLPGDVGNLPLLESLELLNVVDDIPGHWFAATSSLRMANFYSQVPSDLFIMDLTKVEKVRMEVVTMEAVYYLGIHAPLLCGLHIHVLYSGDHIPNLTFAGLRTLCVIDVAESVGLQQLFTSTTMPNLHILRLKNRSSAWYQTEFTMFLNRSSCELQTLSLEKFVITDTEILELLPLLPALESFLLMESSAAPGAISSRLVHALGQLVPDEGHRQQPSFVHLPHLHVLELRGAFIGRDVENELLSTLEARTEGDSSRCRLRHVTVGVMVGTEMAGESLTSHRTSFTDTSLQRFESLKDRGVSVVLDTP